MVQIIEENRKPSFRDQLLAGLSQGAQVASTEIPRMLMGQQQGRQENEALKRFGTDITGIHDPKMRQIIIQNQLKGQSDKPDMSGAVRALDTLEGKLGKPGIGRSGVLNYSSKARFNRGEFESTQAAILPLFKSMFPRGMTEKEFKFIQEKYIPQASDSEEKIRGKIQGLRQLVGQQGGGSGRSQEGQQGGMREMRDASGNIYDIPEHLYEQARAKGLM